MTVTEDTSNKAQIMDTQMDRRTTGKKKKQSNKEEHEVVENVPKKPKEQSVTSHAAKLITNTMRWSESGLLMKC